MSPNSSNMWDDKNTLNVNKIISPTLLWNSFHSNVINSYKKLFVVYATTHYCTTNSFYKPVRRSKAYRISNITTSPHFTSCKPYNIYTYNWIMYIMHNDHKQNSGDVWLNKLHRRNVFITNRTSSNHRVEFNSVIHRFSTFFISCSVTGLRDYHSNSGW